VTLGKAFQQSTGAFSVYELTTFLYLFTSLITTPAFYMCFATTGDQQ